MSKKVAVNNLDGRGVEIMNTILDNAPAGLADDVTRALEGMAPEELTAIGMNIYGNAAIKNISIGLINKIVATYVSHLLFQNPYNRFIKRAFEYGRTVESVWVEMATARKFMAGKASERQFSREKNKTKVVFHTMNWDAQYKVTIEEEELRGAFLSPEALETFIKSLIDKLYRAAEYDEFLLTKYLIMRGVLDGKLTTIKFDSTPKDFGKKVLALPGAMSFPSTKYSEAENLTATPLSKQYIIVDNTFKIEYDVEVLAVAYNMSKVEILERLLIIDNFTDFDFDRFKSYIKDDEKALRDFTPAEKTKLTGVKAIVVNEDWFQMYDLLNKSSFTYVEAGMMYQYFLNVRKIVDNTPFAQAVAIVDGNDWDRVFPDTLEVEVTDLSTDGDTSIYTLSGPVIDGEEIAKYSYVTNLNSIDKKVGVHRYGAIIIKKGTTGYKVTLNVEGIEYEQTSNFVLSLGVGSKIELTKK